MSVVLYEKRERIAGVTLNRPPAMNALDDALNDALWAVWADFAADPGLDVAILSGAGGGLTRGQHRITKPVIAAINGIALGGGFDLALAGREIDAAAAHRRRLVSAVVDPEQLLATAEAWAKRIAGNSQPAIPSAKETALDLIGRPLDDALRLETLNGYSCVGDFADARARLEKFFAAPSTPKEQS